MSTTTTKANIKQHCTTHSVHNGYVPQSKRCLKKKKKKHTTQKLHRLSSSHFSFVSYSHRYAQYHLFAFCEVARLICFCGSSSCYMMLLHGRHLYWCVHDRLLE